MQRLFRDAVLEWVRAHWHTEQFEALRAVYDTPDAYCGQFTRFNPRWMGDEEVEFAADCFGGIVCVHDPTRPAGFQVGFVEVRVCW